MGFWKTTVIAACTAVLIIWLPRLFTPKRKAVFGGSSDPKWKNVEEIFRKRVLDGAERGGAFAVYHRGKLVVNLQGGYADAGAGVPWRPDTLSCYFSATKAVGAILIAVLVDRGLLDYDQPVAKYWPEFAQHGKEKVTLRQLLSHQAGLSAFHKPISFFSFQNNPREAAGIAAESKPLWKLGDGHGYHAFTFGVFMDELIRRVDKHHRNISQFLEDEVRKRFNVDFFIGLPRNEQHRVARIEPVSFFEFTSQALMSEYYAFWKGRFNIMIGGNPILRKTYSTFKEELLVNDPLFREVPFASFTGYGTAEGMAKLWGILANGGRLDGEELMGTKTISMLERPVISGVDKILEINVTLGVGTLLLKSRKGDHFTAGHPGYGGQMGYMDKEHGIAWAYQTNNLNLQFETENYKAYVNAVYDALENK